jgi:hypothetical protein
LIGPLGGLISLPFLGLDSCSVDEFQLDGCRTGVSGNESGGIRGLSDNE